MRTLPFAALIISGLLCGAVRADFPELFDTEPISDESLMPADQAAAAIKLPDGFRAVAFASEPDVQNPIAMSWDARGRLWIAENYTYAERGQRFQLDLRDRIVIFDNTSGDRFNKRTVFTDNVQMLTGLEVGHDGVWLMCPPQLIFIPDRDHDDVPDNDGEVVLDGFTVAQQNYHNFANGLRFGPDGWLYGRCGGSCPGRIGVPGAPDHHRLALEGGMWRYHPVRGSLEVLTTGTTNPWGHDWDEYGEVFFVNTVNGHLWHMIPGAHFTRPFTLDPNPRTYELIDFHADHWHFDTGKNWTDSRDGAANSYGGGHAHSGTMIYQGDNWPDQYRGKLFTLNFHGRRANQERLVRDGSGYVAKHAEDFFIAGDEWFRGMELSSGPDGSVFVLDWSDAGECHEHTGVHRHSGRIFKISHESKKPNASGEFDLRSWTEDQLVEAQSSSNDWFVRQSRLELTRRSALSQEFANLIGMLQQRFTAAAGDPQKQLQLLLTLHAMGGIGDEFRAAQLQHENEHLRTWAIRLLTENWRLDDTMGPVWLSEAEKTKLKRKTEKLLPTLEKMAREDESPLVRLTLASTLQRLPVESRPILAKALVAHSSDADDHNLPLMIWYGLIAVGQEDCESLVAVARACQLPTTLRLISRCVAEEIEDQPDAIGQLLLAAASKDDDYRFDVLTGIAEGLKGWRRAPQPNGWDQFARLESDKTRKLIRELSVVFGDGRALDELKAIATGKVDAEPAMRLAALETLIQNEPDDLRSICESLLRDGRMNVLAARGLSKFDDPEIGQLLVSRYNNFRGPYRPQIMSLLVSRKSFATAMLDAIDRGRIPRGDLSAFQVRQIHSLDDPDLNRRVSEVWGEIRESTAEKAAAIESWKETLGSQTDDKVDLSSGRALFVKHCQNCHRLYGDGEKIGPDLTGANRGNLDYLLGNIIDPSSVVDKDFRMTVVLTEDGRVINGLVTEENDRTMKIQTATELLTLDKEAVESRRMTEKSPMPDGLLDTLSTQQVRDLISYLRHPSQVPLP